MVVFVLAWPTSDMIAPVRLRPWKELDFFGAFLLIVASVLVVFSFQEAGIKVNSWSKAIFIAPLLVGIVCWVLLFCWEVLVARKWEKKVATMFPLRLLKQRVFMGHFITTLLAGFPYFMVIFALPLRMQVVNGRSQLASGIALLPMLGSVAIASTAAGIVNSKKDLIWPTLLTGSLLMVIGCATLSTLDNVVHVEAKTYGFQVFMGLGFGLLVSTVSLGSSLECELRDRSRSFSLTRSITNYRSRDARSHCSSSRTGWQYRHCSLKCHPWRITAARYWYTCVITATVYTSRLGERFNTSSTASRSASIFGLILRKHESVGCYLGGVRCCNYVDVSKEANGDHG